jgi:D-alanyl-D-alanine carboxypeptidase (penicillin-binding protein 5/6)
MRKRRIGILILVLCLVLLPVKEARAENFIAQETEQESAAQERETESAAVVSALSENELYAKGAVLLDGDSGRMLYGKNEAVPMANASTTKILTCIVTLENAGLDEVVTASKNAAKQPKVHLGMQEGEQFTIRDLLYALMLESYNDCAVALAEQVAGSVEAFAVLMNEKAKEIGCTDSYFITPNGLDAQDETGTHHTTALDLARIMKYCAWDSPKSAEFLVITQTEYYTFANLSGQSYTVTNKNAFLQMMDGVITGKTGFTANAGYCYVAAMESQGRKFCIALLACGWPNNRTYKWSDARKLFSYGMENFHYADVGELKKLNEIPVQNGRREDAVLSDWGTSCKIRPVYEDKDMATRYLIRDGQEITVSYEVAEYLTAPLEEGTVLGKVSVCLDGEELESIKILTKENILAWKWADLRALVWKQYFLTIDVEKLGKMI